MREDEGILTVTVERYGDIEGRIVAIVATHPTEGTAKGNFKPFMGDNLCNKSLDSLYGFTTNTPSRYGTPKCCNYNM